MSKRVSGKPRHPRSPVAKAVRTPAFRMRVVPDKRWTSKLQVDDKNGDKDAGTGGKDDAVEPDKD